VAPIEGPQVFICGPELNNDRRFAEPSVPSDASPIIEPLLGSADTVPIYEYVCMECESHFEELVRNGEQPDCPDCASANVRKQFSVFATHGTADQPTYGSSGGCCGGSCGCS
jgi:putative FmdB family regulatory protein